jgi:tRNA nucleotidyltransferase (CCA-adding enzyme)
VSRPEERAETFEHRADVGVRGIGPTRAAAFAQAALALTRVVSDPRRVRETQAVDLACEGDDDELLLLDWLNAVIYEMATRRMLFARFHVSLAAGRLSATGWGEPVDPVRHEPAVEVKGATATELAVRPTSGGGWLAQCVVDV